MRPLLGGTLQRQQLPTNEFASRCGNEGCEAQEVAGSRMERQSRNCWERTVPLHDLERLGEHGRPVRGVLWLRCGHEVTAALNGTPWRGGCSVVRSGGQVASPRSSLSESPLIRVGPRSLGHPAAASEPPAGPIVRAPAGLDGQVPRQSSARSGGRSEPLSPHETSVSLRAAAMPGEAPESRKSLCGEGASRGRSAPGPALRA